MNTLRVSVIIVSLLFAGVVEAKCYRFGKGGDIQVCVKGDGFPEQRKGEAVCSKIKGASCGEVNAVSSSCQGACFDEGGRKHNSLTGY